MEYSRKWAHSVIDRMLSREPLVKILVNGQQRDAFWRVMEANSDVQDSFNRAQAIIAEMGATEILDIADTELNWVLARNKIDARKWYAEKILPLKYGNRVDVNMNHRVDINAVLLEASSRLVSIASSNPTDTQLLTHQGKESDIIDINTISTTDYKSVIDPNAAQEDAVQLAQQVEDLLS